jgi:hypothetical protein
MNTFPPAPPVHQEPPPDVAGETIREPDQAAATAASIQAAPQLPAEGAQVPTEIASAPVGSLAQPAPEQEDRQVQHNQPVLTQGATGEPVELLCKLLAHAGYANNTVVRGENPHNVLDSSVMADVERFWMANPDAVEPPELVAGREGDLSQLQGKWVGPHTWQKLLELAGAL